MNDLRVLMVNKFLYPRGGAEVYMLDLADELESRGAECRFFAMKDDRNRPASTEKLFPRPVDFEHPSGILQPLRSSLRMLYSGSARRGMARLLDSWRPDVAHVHNIYHQLSPSVLAPLRNAGVPIVMTAHDYKLVCPVYTLLSGDQVCTRCVGGTYRHAVVHRCNRGSVAASAMVAAESRMHRTLRLYLGAVDVYIAPSRYLARMLVEGGYPAERVHVIPNFTRAVAVDETPAGSSLLCAGRLAPMKGVDVLLDAMEGTDVELRVAGDGPERARLERVAAERRLNVTFLGQLDRERLGREMRRSRAVVVPSVWPENCPLGVMAAMAHGRAVIATDIGGIPELVTDGETGLLVPARDPRALRRAMLELAGDAQLAGALGAAGLRRAKAEFTAELHLARVSALYDDVRHTSSGSEAA